MLKLQDVLESSNIVVKGIALVKPTANKSKCNNIGNRKRHNVPVNTAKTQCVQLGQTSS